MQYNSLSERDLVTDLILLSCVKAEVATKRGGCNLNGASNGLHLCKTPLRHTIIFLQSETRRAAERQM